MVAKAVHDLGVEKAGLVPSAPLLSCHAGSAKQQFLCSGTGFFLLTGNSGGLPSSPRSFATAGFNESTKQTQACLLRPEGWLAVSREHSIAML